ncbi:halocin C8-like domain-containing protein [Corynebacterium pseudodiphtheriticum]|uniref:halocin C8-like domain-containing protein n=1 Tax=Corynebacterium pseudodiphtheriticum TaxID=37637 RepID=UPI00345EFAC0
MRSKWRSGWCYHCGLLGLSVVAGIACGGVLALIAMFGCEEAKKRVCRNARG